MSDTDTAEDDDYFQSPEFEALYDRVWHIALTHAGLNWDEHEDRLGVLFPTQAVAEALIAMGKEVTPERQKLVLEQAADWGEEVIRRTELELVEMRRAVEALRQPRSQLMRSRIGLVHSEAPKA